MLRLLIHSLYPAPYRVEIFKSLMERFDCDVFFSFATGDDRKKEWFMEGGYNLLEDIEGLKRYNSSVKNLKSYDAVLIYEYSDVNAIKLILRCIKQRVPYFINCDGVMLFEHGNFIKNIVKRFLIKHATAYFAGSKHAKNYFLGYGAKEENIYFHNFTALHECDILKAPISATKKRELREKLGLPVDAKICIAVGRYIPLKRYDVLLRLWKRMPQYSYLLLIGGGPEKNNYERIISDDSLNNVILEDFHPFQELLEYYKAADLFLHPTSYDVWGLIINEAMACGLPVVVTDTCVAGLELIVSGENGFVTHLGDDEDFISKAQLILSDDALREKMSSSNVEKIRAFTMENMVASQISTINKVLLDNAK